MKHSVFYLALSLSLSFHILLKGWKGGNKMSEISGNDNGFALIVVLFILLIIVGAAFLGNSYDGGGCYEDGCGGY